MSLFALALVLSGAGGAATAQADDRLTRDYLACAMPQRTKEMVDLLNTMDEGDYGRAANSVTAVERCAKTEKEATAPFMAAFGADRGKLRGMVAEALLNGAQRAGQLAPLPPMKVYAANWFLLSGRPRPVDEMAMCVAETDPAGIEALLATAPASRAQSRALSALTPSIGNCLARGYQLNTMPTGLRSALAEALYHRAFPASGAAR